MGVLMVMEIAVIICALSVSIYCLGELWNDIQNGKLERNSYIMNNYILKEKKNND